MNRLLFLIGAPAYLVSEFTRGSWTFPYAIYALCTWLYCTCILTAFFVTIFTFKAKS